MKKIEIEIPDGKKAEWVNGVLTLVDDKPKDITERIKTFEDALAKLGEDNTMVAAFRYNEEIDECDKDVIAYLKLRIICAALNEGWEPKFTEDEFRYYPWYYLYTKEDYENLSDEEKENSRVLGRGGSSASAYSGLACAYANFVSSFSVTSYGSRLAFKSERLAEYAGRQFIEIFADFCFKTE